VLFYLDASVLVALMDDEPTRPLFDTFLMQDGATFVVSDFAVAETSAALTALWRARRQSPAFSQAELERFDDWTNDFTDRVHIASLDTEEAIHHVRRSDIALRAPDAIHIAATYRLGATLLTLDRGMTRAALALSVPCINPAEPSAN